ncbi:hypothetical protein GF377_01365 [candidate division GN15 bacterium]|nr:hypothetical protein [candidate division GN15 bacterium]
MTQSTPETTATPDIVPGFQTEPGIRRVLLDNATNDEAYRPEPEALVTGVESLLFSLRFRDWLIDSERLLLDMMAPENAVTFLILGGRYIHPEDVELFPMEVIDATLHRGGEAIFIHRYQPESGYGSDCYKIHTTHIGRIHDRDLILGILSPDRLANSNNHEDFFGRLASVFRQAWEKTETSARETRSRLDFDRPTALINRASGRVILTSQLLSEDLELGVRDITGHEAGGLIQLARGVDPSAVLRLENLDVPGMHLCLGTIRMNVRMNKGATTSADTGAANEIAFLVHGLRNSFAAVAAAASHLETLLPDNATGEQHELAQLIQSEILSSDTHLERIRLLSGYARVEPSLMSPTHEIIGGVEQARKSFADHCRIDRDLPKHEVPCRLVAGSLRLLTDACLRAHLQNTRISTNTDVRLRMDTSQIIMTIETRIAADREDANQDGLRTSRNWASIADELARRMGASRRQSGQPASGLLTTTVTLKYVRQ